MTLFTLATILATAVLPADSLGLSLERELRPYLAQRAAAGRFSGVVVVARAGTPIFSAAYGHADRARRVPNAVTTRFNLGSANKMWTAVAIAQLVERGLIDLEAPVGRYVPDLPNPTVRDRVTIRQLLTHTSGLGSYFQNGFLRDRTVVQSMADYLPFFIRDSLEFAPGRDVGYSNAGYALLGLVIERVTNASFYDYMRTNVLAKFAPRNDAFIDARRPPADVATGYATPPGAREAQPNWALIEQRSSPAGGAFASALDMVAFGRALWSGKLVGMEQVQRFTTGQVPMGPGIRYGFGFGDRTTNGWRHVGHNGGIPGANAEFAMFPEHALDVVVLANQDAPAATEVFQRVLSVITGGAVAGVSRAPDPPATSAPPPASAAGARVSARAEALPDDLQGRRAAAFLEAFGQGSGQAIAAFLAAHAAPISDRAADERANQFESWYDTAGALRVERVLQQTATRLEVGVLSARGAPYTLTLTFEATAPHRITDFALTARR